MPRKGRTTPPSLQSLKARSPPWFRYPALYPSAPLTPAPPPLPCPRGALHYPGDRTPGPGLDGQRPGACTADPGQRLNTNDLKCPIQNRSTKSQLEAIRMEACSNSMAEIVCVTMRRVAEPANTCTDCCAYLTHSTVTYWVYIPPLHKASRA